LLVIAGRELPAQPLQIHLDRSTFELSWSVQWNPSTSVFEYRYTISNRGPDPETGLRWTVGEDQLRSHAGLHHEDPAGLPVWEEDAMDLDPAPGIPLFPFPTHNYDWQDLALDSGESVVLGFDDPHAPGFGVWQLSLQSSRRRIRSPAVPVPAVDALGQVSLDLGGGNIKRIDLLGSWFEPAGASGGRYRYTLTNAGNVIIGLDDPAQTCPPPNDAVPEDNHVDFYVNEHPTHRGIHHEDFTLEPDNDFADETGTDVECAPGQRGHTNSACGNCEGFPPGVSRTHQAYWVGLGNGPATPPAGWQPGEVIIVGYSDEHLPGLVGWGIRVVGSFAEGFFDEPQQQVVVPAAPTEIPTLGPWRLLVFAALLGALALLALYHR
jgi:hypothetical protein